MKQAKYIFAAALAMLALGCNKEQVAVDGTPDGEEVAVTFAAELPGTITKAIGDGLTAKNLSVAVYDDASNAAGTHIVALDKTAVFDALHTTVEYSLVKGKTYHFIFWAQAEGAPYTFNPETKKVAINYTGAANDEKRDAFYAVKTLKVTGPATEPVQLHRPFAQVNFGTSDSAAATAAGVTPTASLFTATDAASSFDVFAGEGTDPVRVSFTEATLPAEQLTLKDGTSYTYLAMNYFIPTGKLSETHVSNLSATFKGASDDVVISVPSAKVQANYRTNIVGNLLTDQVVFNVEIVPAFEDEENINLTNISTLNELKTLFAVGGSATLMADITVPESVILKGNKIVNLNLGGKTLTYAGTQNALFRVEEGTLVIDGDGSITGGGDEANERVMFLAKGAESHLIIRNGSFKMGKCTASEHDWYDCVYALNDGKIDIYGGTFETEATRPNGKRYIINVNNQNPGVVNVYGGKFIGYDPKTGDDYLGGSFLAPGYKSTEVLGTWYVSKATASPVVPAAGQSELDNILATGVSADVKLADGTYKLPATIADGVSISGQTGSEVIDGSVTAKITAKDFSVSDVIIKGSGKGVDGSSIALEGANSTVSNCNFENGRQANYGSDLSVSQAAGSVTTITGCDFRKSGFRGIMIWATGDEVKIDNCLFDNTYPFNCDAGTGKITVTDCELNGWTSYTNTVEVVTFTNCKFGKSTSGYAFLRPYCKTIITDCTFSSDFQINLNGSSTYTVELINCKYEDGTALGTAFIDADGFNPNATLIIDGQTYRF